MKREKNIRAKGPSLVAFRQCVLGAKILACTVLSQYCNPIYVCIGDCWLNVSRQIWFMKAEVITPCHISGVPEQ